MRTRGKRGIAMVVVVSSLSLAAVVALAGLAVSQRLATSGASSESVAAASSAANAALDAIVAESANSKSWRTTPTVPSTVGSATITVALSDATDGDLFDSYDDPVRVTVTATQGAARRIVQADLSPNTAPADALGYCLCVGGNMSGVSDNLTAMGKVYVGGKLTGTGITVPGAATYGYVIAVPDSTEPEAPGAVKAATAAVTVPASADVLKSFTDISTTLTSTTDISGVLLSSGYNPIGGGLNSLGVYSIGNGSSNIEISHSRINACLIVHALRFTIGDGVEFDPPAGLPALIVIGDVRVSGDGSRLSEASAKVNFNPLSSPYGGVSDSDKLDGYPTEIDGLMYVSGSVALTGNLVVNGPLLVGGGLTLGADLVLRCAGVTSGPMGFRASPAFKVTRGSVRRQVD